MTRIIVARYMEPTQAEKLNTLKQRVQEQLPEGYLVVVVPHGVELFELSAKEPIYHTELAEPPANTTESPSGRVVEHVDVPDDDAPIRFVWMTRAECTDEQRAMGIGHDDTGPITKWAIPVDQLSEEDQVRYADRVREL